MQATQLLSDKYLSHPDGNHLTCDSEHTRGHLGRKKRQHSQSNTYLSIQLGQSGKDTLSPSRQPVSF